MAQNRVSLSILDAKYTVSSDDSAEYMKEVGREVDRTLREMLEANPHLSQYTAAVLAAVNNLDRARKAEIAADRLRSQVAAYLEETQALRAEMEALRKLYS